MESKQKKINPENLYYENDDIWSKDFELDHNEKERFDITENLILKDSNSIVDVGCGNGDFLKRLDGKYSRLCGVERSKTALERVSVEKFEASIDSLPFEKAEFDSVFCLEVIEHLPIHIYSEGLKELSRVAQKQVIISVPFDENTKADLVTCPSCSCSFNRNYHLRRFDENKMANLFKGIDDGLQMDQFFLAGTSLHPIGLNMMKKALSVYRKPRLPKGVVCPQCSYTDLIPSENQKKLDVNTNKKSSGSSIRSMMPKIKKPRWIIASYIRK